MTVEQRPGAVTEHELAVLRGAVERSLPEYLAGLATLVNIDSGSYTKEGVDRVGGWLAGALERLGARVESVPGGELGDTVVATFERPGGAYGSRLLLIGHLDTVFDAGTALERPFRIDPDGRARGPGVTDMKSGLLAGLYALAALRSLGDGRADDAAARPGSGWLPFERLVYIANPDEEIGSPVSGAVIREHAATAEAVLVLECARANGDIVSARKGVADLRVTIRGHAAHAGIEPEKGRHAILEAAHKTIALQALNGRWPGVTVNVGVVRGGTRPNVVPEEAHLEIDLRATTRAALEAVEAEVAAICARPTVPDVTAEVDERARHWPMEKLAGTSRLVDHARTLARTLGFELRDAATGGASDANTTAGLGIPTLDGLGPVGGLDHSPDEYLEVGSIVPRVTLLAALMLAISRDETLPSLRGR